jgi:hypothetical protein
VRTGDPNDDPDDLDSEVWAGVVPMTTQFGSPIPAANLANDASIPASVNHLVEQHTNPTDPEL